MRALRWLLPFGLILLLAAVYVWRVQKIQSACEAVLRQSAQGPIDENSPEWSDCLPHRSGDVVLISTLARNALDAGRQGEAVEYLTRWLAAEPNAVQALRLRRDLFRERREFDRALADAERIDLLPEVEPADRRLLISLSLNAGKLQEAVAAGEAFLKAQPGDRPTLILLAEAYRAIGNLDNAAQRLDQVLQLQPDHAAALMARAALYAQQGRPELAIPLYLRVRDINPQWRRAAGYHLSVALAQAGRLEEAEKLRTEVRRLQDAQVLYEESQGQLKNAEIQVRAARALLAADDPDRALKVIRVALALDPAYPAAHAFLAEYYTRQGDPENAASHRKQAGVK